MAGIPSSLFRLAGGFSRYFIGLFMLFWLGMWQIGISRRGSQKCWPETPRLS